jgi:hypothetical protein
MRQLSLNLVYSLGVWEPIHFGIRFGRSAAPEEERRRNSGEKPKRFTQPLFTSTRCAAASVFNGTDRDACVEMQPVCISQQLFDADLRDPTSE